MAASVVGGKMTSRESSHVLYVDLGDGDPLPLSVQSADNEYAVAAKFMEDHSVVGDYLETFASHIRSFLQRMQTAIDAAKQ